VVQGQGVLNAGEDCAAGDESAAAPGDPRELLSQPGDRPSRQILAVTGLAHRLFVFLACFLL
jgi:hypothetical protein